MMTRSQRFFVSLFCLPLLAACSKSSDEAEKPAGDEFVFDTGQFEVESAAEKYLCFTRTLTEDMSVDRIWYDGKAVVHHLVMVKTLAPEPEGPFECPTFFKTTWIPLFANGTGAGSVDLPAGSTFKLTKGTQLLVQLHLLNTTEATRKDAVQIRMHPTEPTDNLAGIYGFGTTKVELPAKQKTSLTNDCKVDKDVDIFAVFPHMHTRGTSLTFSVGKDEASLSEVFRVDPWDFDQQSIDPISLTLKPGDLTRVVCSYDNPTDKPIKFGESTFDEMCFFTAFRTNFQDLDGCIDLGGWGGQTPGGDGGTGDGGTTTCEPSANELGVGGPCTPGGNECTGGLSCSSDLEGTGEPGFCMKLGCQATSECGSNSVCCTPAQSGGIINICLPESCQPTDCANVP
jgi:hypothetical protein